MISVSKGVVIGSFPGHSLIREPQRKFRYRLKGIPVYFFDRAQIDELGSMEGLARYEVDELDGGYVLAGYV